MKSLITGLLATLILASQPTLAENHTIPTIVITATRTAQSVDESLATVSVIDRAMIDQSQATTLPELLRTLPGAELITLGGYGKESSLYLRGTNTNHMLVLIDGIRVGSATLGTVALANLPLAQVERIEVVRGPRSSLYGSEAIGGVMQIFTRRGRDGIDGNFELGYGSFDTQTFSGGISGGANGSHFNLQASHLVSNNIDIQNGTDPDKDGYENNSVSTTLGHRFGNWGEIELHWLRSEGENEFDAYPGETEFLEQTIGARLQFTPVDWWSITLKAAEGRDENDNLAANIVVTRFNTQRISAGWQNDLMLGDDHLLTLGIDSTHEEVDSLTAYSETERENIGGFAEWQSAYGNNDLVISLRHDDSDRSSGHTTGNIDWGYGFANGVRLSASYGTAFKMPTFNDLFFPADPWSAGNPDLEPELSKSFELGLKGRHDWGNWGLHGYTTRIDNMIEWACTSGSAICNDADWSNDFWQPSNVSSAQIDGIEALFNLQRSDWNLNLTLNLLDPRDTDSGNTLQRRSQQSMSLAFDKRFGPISAGLTVDAHGERYNDRSNSYKLDAYTLTSMRLAYEPVKRWQLRLKIDNLFDVDYEPALHYNNPGRSVLASVAYGLK
ncbi:hypothetical protein BOW53_13170 [Solemya pervernicosa gill symbiont]|uniref:TonB-dependent vitamin B12 receptor n=2 Tax=Gammaproteobacteria incertae sedis TaxID=118884 RepID=A0A1T2L1R4_9GAMM|nr:TonB-dependent receptor [Candidatus Reidiella endopervernicosa]OOZ39035.1 hypothetical protein BOW53_13170 [Solemya pervernicosa gill symbiont]QKQ27687.1 TonB-dependent receptor [Candidatus Reidiella endopervernicosa]